jgi:sugar lactone lactonase YvrE
MSKLDHRRRLLFVVMGATAVASVACSAILGDFVTTQGSGAGDGAPGDDGAAMGDGAHGADTGSGGEAGGDAMSAVPGAPSGVMAAAVPVVTTVSTLAGSGAYGSADGTGAAASFGGPNSVAVDAAGIVYVADTGNMRIRKITPAGVVTTLAGSTNGFADGTGAAAMFSIPLGVAVDRVSGAIYVADGGNNRIRKVTPDGIVTTLAGSATGGYVNANGAAAQFNGPVAVAVDSTGNVLVADQTNQRIRLVTPGGDVSLVAGSGTATFADGQGASASFDYPAGIAANGGNLWVADDSNHRVRKITPTGAVTTLAGSSASTPFADGIGGAATFSGPQGMALDGADNAFVGDQGHHRIRMVTAAGEVTTLAGTGTGAFADGPAATASFNSPAGVAVDSARNVYVCDQSNNRIRKISSAGIRQIAVSWTAPSNPGSSPITGYKATASAVGFAPQSCTTTGATSCTIIGLTSNILYSVAVTATNAAGTSAVSAPISATPN